MRQRRPLAMVLSMLTFALTGVLVTTGTAAAVPAAQFAPPIVTEPRVVCVPGDVACDVDGDRIPDDVEEVVCGSVTCATGAEDVDLDGLGDWVEFQASRSVVGVDPGADKDVDGIPDFAERVVCGSGSCVRGREDVDRDGVADWVEVVICGDVTCADGTEDLDGDGVADAARLASCVVYGRGDGWASTVWRGVFGGSAPGWLPRTGVQVAGAVVVVVVVLGAGVGALVWSRRRRVAGRGLDDLAGLLDARDAR